MKRNASNPYFRMILTFAALAALAALLTGVSSHAGARAVLMAQFERSLLDSSATISGAVGERVSSAVKIAEKVASSDALKNADYTAAVELLKKAVDLSDFFYNAYFYDSGGKLAALAYADGRDTGPYIGSDFRDRSAIKSGADVRAAIERAYSEKKAVFSEPFYSAGGRLLFIYVVPVVSAGGGGVLTFGINGSEKNFAALMNALAPGSAGGFVGLIGGTGEVFASAGAIPDQVRKNFASFERGVMTACGDCFIVTRREPVSGVVVTVGIPEAAVSGPLRGLARRTAAITIVFMIAGAAFSAFYARSIIRPLALLVDGMKKVGEGAYSQRLAPSPPGSEVAGAVDAFNSMCEKLEKVKIIESVWTERWHV